ncbi:hypothetical protein JOD31_003250 [Methylopila capsulata]|uniref:Uncharacterized protein n=1 Tax=Methylopila capsulata TaxID=61654 RepID=A0A9W6MTG7_9HYPH|nr:transferase [Methylopila capsulata]MBM7852999.1 hypothetical protein [Methylopila capsulata]GLK57790.1 hypothetical protein GCM10008170_38100 [Methylopila capsulata]
MPSAYASGSVSGAAHPAVVAAMNLDDMRAFLQRSRPATTAEALRLLRGAFPAAPLRLRVAACEG